MTNEETGKRWPTVPPFGARLIDIWGPAGPIGTLRELETMEVNQDTIDDIIDYFQAVKECMNE